MGKVSANDTSLLMVCESSTFGEKKEYLTSMSLMLSVIDCVEIPVMNEL